VVCALIEAVRELFRIELLDCAEMGIAMGASVVLV